ncbi:MAG: hypothetical protein PHF46_00875 [Candidatus Gracilibacteria bacterium]|nr:hypothetical protein [Candidatus Gracilibacteria bacterium]MDD3119945.1 hypothetical protein [Candidatus Gracilibacteria bacterium]MDD4530164.1 hypothetical protein [Candidatus Gracilibacteria bacterium]
MNSREADLRKTTIELEKSKKQKESLVDKFLSDDSDKTTYDYKKEKIEQNTSELEEKLKALKQGDDNILKIIEDWCELVENLSEAIKSEIRVKKQKLLD